MKHEKILSFLWSAVLAFLMAYGTVGCFATGFDMAYNFWTPLILGMAAIVGAVCFIFFGGAALALGLLALGCGYAWRTGDLVLQTQAVLHRVSKGYHSAYGWAVLSWPDVNLQNVPIDVPMILVGAMIILCVCWTVSRKQPAWLAAVLSLLPLIACVVVTDTVPDSSMLFLYFLGLILLLLTQGVRRMEPDAGNRLTVILAVPVTLCLALLFWLVPRDSYQPLDEATSDRVMAWFDSLRDVDLEEDLSQWVEGVASRKKVEKVRLDTLGNRHEYRYPVMEVIAPATGPLYLRGYAYDVYDGVSWTASEESWTKAFEFWRGSQVLGTVEIKTEGAHDVIYFPYAPGNGPVRDTVGGSYLNSNEWTSYSFTQFQTSGYREYLNQLDARKTLAPGEMSQYLQLPTETRQRALYYLRVHQPDDLWQYPQYQVLDIAENIADLVSGTAAYSLNTGRMPTDETDFALWFLEEGETGYCVHYATAATVLLRAAGIPARYVTGYLVDAEANTTVEVVGGDAHAWVEYWHPDLGWLRLEVTPGSGSGEEPETTTTEAEEQTTLPEDDPEETQGSDDQQPTPSLQPDTPDVPEGTEDPGQNTGGKSEVDWTPILRFLGISTAVILLVAGQWKLRLRYRRYRMKQGSPNEQALYRWRFMNLQTRLLGILPVEEARTLAEKAKFSQHTLTKQELATLDRWMKLYDTQLREQSLIRRVISCLIFAAC